MPVQVPPAAYWKEKDWFDSEAGFQLQSVRVLALKWKPSSVSSKLCPTMISSPWSSSFFNFHGRSEPLNLSGTAEAGLGI